MGYWVGAGRWAPWAVLRGAQARRWYAPGMPHASPRTILDEVRGERCEVPGEQAHRRRCPLCARARDNTGARVLAALESRYIRWAPAVELARTAGLEPADVEDHARTFGLDRLRLEHLEDAAARALELALAGDPCGRVALSALDRLRDLAATDPRPAPVAPAAGPAPEPDSWEASLGISPSPEDEEGEPH